MGYQPINCTVIPLPPTRARVVVNREYANCPNCNAVLSYKGGLHCDYCGAQFERPSDYDDVGEMVIRDWTGNVVMTIPKDRMNALR